MAFEDLVEQTTENEEPTADLELYIESRENRCVWKDDHIMCNRERIA